MRNSTDAAGTVVEQTGYATHGERLDDLEPGAALDAEVLVEQGAAEALDDAI